MRVFTILALSILFCVMGSACAPARSINERSTLSSPKLESTPSDIDRDGARAFSDEVVKAIIEDEKKALYSKMENTFRESYPEKEFDALLASVFSPYGKPVSAQFKKDESGFVAYTTGEKKSIRKFWYAVQTDKDKTATFYLFTHIVSDGKNLWCNAFSIVTFPLGAPDDMQ